MSFLENIGKKEILLKKEAAYGLLERCRLCPRRCGVNRLKDEKGFCGMGRDIVISSFGPHFGEEDVLVGRHGSGTIFLTGCSLGCSFCQNYDISHLRLGYKVTPERFTGIMLELQGLGCHNINFVTPTHFVPQIIDALSAAKDKGLGIPLVFNCGGYESVETLKLLDGIMDIYMPDAKFADEKVSKKFCGAPDYPAVMKEALLEMHAQTGDLELDKDGIAVKGLLVRHLVLPDKMSGTKDIMHFLKMRISKDTYVNIMDQYRPLYEAKKFPKINRRITQDEYDEAVRIAKDEGLHRGFFGG